jgi:hypothetical protein
MYNSLKYSAYPLFFLAFMACGTPDVVPVTPASTKVLQTTQVGDSFVAFADAQQFPGATWFLPGGPRERRLVRKKIRELAPELLLFGGDAVAWGAWGCFWEQFSHDYKGMEIFPVIGNHDLMGDGDVGLDYYFTTFPQLHGSRWYPVTFGPLRILMLDSNYDKMGEMLWKRQMAWLDDQLEKAEKDPKIGLVGIITHHPAYSAIVGRGWHEVITDIYPRAARHPKYRFHFSGHYHLYQHLIEDDYRHYFVIGGGGGPLYCGGSRDLPPNVHLVAAACNHHVVRAELEKDALRLETHIMSRDGDWEIQEQTRIAYDKSLRLPPFVP